MFNHGALVETIGAAIERVRASGGGLEIAILDIDNFRILNDTWGHAAGDEAILAVNDLLQPLVPSSLAVGRYGPDEFLIAVDGARGRQPARGDRGHPGGARSVRLRSATATTCRSRSVERSPGSPTTASP